MVLVDILDCLLRHDFRLEQLTAVRSNSHVLELKPLGLFRVLLNNDNVLDTNAEFTILVEARLVTNAHSFGERDSASATNADRALMDAKTASDAVTGAMLVLQPDLHEMPPRKEVKITTMHFACLWPDSSLDVEISHQDARVAILLKVSWLSKVHCSRDVSRAVEILSARVEQINLSVV